MWTIWGKNSVVYWNVCVAETSHWFVPVLGFFWGGLGFFVCLYCSDMNCLYLCYWYDTGEARRWCFYKQLREINHHSLYSPNTHGTSHEAFDSCLGTILCACSGSNSPVLNSVGFFFLVNPRIAIRWRFRYSWFPAPLLEQLTSHIMSSQLPFTGHYTREEDPGHQASSSRKRTPGPKAHLSYTTQADPVTTHRSGRPSSLHACQLFDRKVMM